MSTGLMGRPKRKTEPGKEPTRFQNLTVRASLEWLAWVERGSRFCRMNKTTAVDVALVEYFRGRGFDEPPPPRY